MLQMTMIENILQIIISYLYLQKIYTILENTILVTYWRNLMQIGCVWLLSSTPRNGVFHVVL